MIDIVFPKDNEQEFIDLARRLNIKGLCMVYAGPKDISGFKAGGLYVTSGVICSPEDISKYKGKHITLCKAPSDQSKIRHIIEQSRPDVLFGLESAKRRDFMHHRASGINHVMAELAKQKGVSIGFSFQELMSAGKDVRPVLQGRMMQNFRFAEKFGFRTVVASFADDPYWMRSPSDLKSFFSCLGMSHGKVGLEVGR